MIFAYFLLDELANRILTDSIFSLSILTTVTDKGLTGLGIIVEKRRTLLLLYRLMREYGCSLEHVASEVGVTTSRLVPRPSIVPVRHSKA